MQPGQERRQQEPKPPFVRLNEHDLRAGSSVTTGALTSSPLGPRVGSGQPGLEVVLDACVDFVAVAS